MFRFLSYCIKFENQIFPVKDMKAM